jgi:hypothetical protein
MNKAMETAHSIGCKTVDIVIGGTSKLLETSAKGLNLLSSIIKGEKKIAIKVEEVK